MSSAEHPAGPHGHVPVLLDRVVDLLLPALADGGLVVDATLGMGGHAEALLEAAPAATLLGLDRDPMALERAGTRLARFGDRFVAARAVYDELPDVLDRLDLPPVRAVLFDLGVSSLQLDQADRGFSYMQDAPLDMRMDGSPESADTSAADLVATASVPELTRILREYGEERFAARIAQRLDRERRVAPVATTGRLVEIVRAAVPAAAQHTGGHPAKRTFQALRIAVNGELEVLARAIPAAIDTLTVGGRMVVLSYHSLEDRLVKQSFAALATDTTPPGLPVPLPEHAPQLRLLVRGDSASAEEVEVNSRAASVRLRAVERIRAAA
ncbi:16S rRNA (cytosine(1402)-N(4))-methyltransferase RsmH [Jatrophihabitans sp. YIM 134969]